MPEKKKKLRPFQMYMRRDLYEKVKQLAEEKGLSFSAYAREAVEKGLEQEKIENEKIIKKIKELPGKVPLNIDLNISRKKR